MDFTPDRLREALAELGRVVDTRGYRFGVVVVGGSALSSWGLNQPSDS
jgi:hypothetical protein